ncbi:MAG: hypothetical protein JWO17_500 [Actinomycetia bacterium]|nr:hypothetical protein [Actinomycetes bacterium]
MSYFSTIGIVGEGDATLLNLWSGFAAWGTIAAAAGFLFAMIALAAFGVANVA